MAQVGKITGDFHVAGALTMQSVTLPSSSVTNANVQAGTNIEATKLQHQRSVIREHFGPSTTVAALSEVTYMAYGAATIVEFAAWTETIATGADRTATIDLQKSTGGGAYATICSVTIVLDNASVNRIKETATLSSATLVAGDILKVVVTVAGAAGNQAIGLSTRAVIREDPD